MTTSDNAITHRLAEHVATASSGDLPEAVLHEGKRSLMNWLACAIAGSQERPVEIEIEALLPFGGAATAAILGRRERTDPLTATLINGTASAVLDFDATQYKFTNIHPSGPIAPAILAHAQSHQVSGHDFLAAFVHGVDAACRVANAVFSGPNPGWHVTGACGALGAAVACGRLMDFTPPTMAEAMGLAANQASGLRAVYGSMAKSFNPGRAGQNGYTAALLAARGFTSSKAILEAPRGFAGVFGPDQDLAPIVHALGEDFEIMLNIYKPFACAIVLHPILDGCLRLRDEDGVSADTIDRVELSVNPRVLELAGNPEPADGLAVKFSVHHATAVALIHGIERVRLLGADTLNDAAVLRLRSKVVPVIDDRLAKDQARVTLVLKDGRRLEQTIEHAVGSLEKPMSDKDIEDKALALAGPVLSPQRARALIDLVWSLETLDTVAPIAEASVPA